MTSNAETRPEAMRVSTIELFFDLVFVFTITQVTHLVEHVPTVWELGHAFLVLTLIWWMFSGYAWLTNSARPGKFLRVVMIAAMGGFLVMALAVPNVFGSGRLAFAIAYLVVIVLHATAFVVTGGRAALKGILEVGPFNLGAGVLVLVAALVDPKWNWVLLLGAVSLFVTATLLGHERSFTLPRLCTGHPFSARCRWKTCGWGSRSRSFSGSWSSASAAMPGSRRAGARAGSARRRLRLSSRGRSASLRSTSSSRGS